MENKSFDRFIKGLPLFCEEIIPVAKRCGVSSLEAFCLVVLAEYPELKEFYSVILKESMQSLLEKGCVKIEGEKFILTSKGAIISKSVSAAKDKIIFE